MVMPHSGSSIHCPYHGPQLSYGCVFECPVCEHVRFLRHYYPDQVEDFEKNWKTSQYNQPDERDFCF